MYTVQSQQYKKYPHIRLVLILPYAFTQELKNVIKTSFSDIILWKISFLLSIQFYKMFFYALLQR